MFASRLLRTVEGHLPDGILKNLLKELQPSTFKNGLTTLDNAFACDQLLSDNACSAEHCPTAMVELHGLVLFLLLWILGPQVKWVKAVVKLLFAIVVGKCGSKLVARGHNPECGPEVLHCRLREVTLHR